MEIRDYKYGEENKILDLFELVFKKKMSLDYWKWRFLDNQVNTTLIKLMWDKDLLVGHYSVFPVHVNYDNICIISGLSMTTMTHPEYNGLGIFPQLANSLYDDLPMKNVELIWGFPNSKSHKTFIKNLGWSNVSSIPILSLEFDKITPIFNENFKVINEFDIKHSKRHKEIFQKYKFYLTKSVEYLNWRYIFCPSSKYIILEIDKITGSFIVCKEYIDKNFNKQIDIVDWCIEENFKITNSIIKHLAYMFEKSIYKCLNIWIPLNDIRHIYFEQLGFNNSLPLTYFCVKPNDKNFLNERDCWFQLGDSDVY